MSDQMLVACPHCNSSLKISLQLQGKIVACPKCKQQFRIGELDDIAEEPSSLAPASPQPAYVADHAKRFSNMPLSPAPNREFGPSPYNPQTNHLPRQHTNSPPISERDRKFFQTGLCFVVLPVFAGVLPLFGLQIRRLAGAGEYASLIAMVFGLVGAGLIFYARRQQVDGIFSGIGASLIALLFGIGGFVVQGYMNREASVARASENQGAAPPNPMIQAQQDAMRAQQEAMRAQQEAVQAEIARMRAQSSRQFEEESFKELEDMLQNNVPPLPSMSPPEMRPGRTVGSGPSLAERSEWMEDGRMMSELSKRAGMGMRNFMPYRMPGNGLEKNYSIENLVGITSKSARLFKDDPVTALCVSYLGRELLLLPIESDVTGFKHVIKPAAGETLVGLRFALDNNLIVGVQGLVQTETSGTPKELPWLGQATADVRTSMNPDPSRCGIICYSDLGKFIGFAWVKPK